MSQKQERESTYVCYWFDGSTEFCWLQLDGNENDLKLLDERLKATPDEITYIDWNKKITESQAVTLHTYGYYHHLAKGKLTLPRDSSGKVEWSKIFGPTTHDQHYFQITSFFAEGHSSTFTTETQKRLDKS